MLRHCPTLFYALHIVIAFWVGLFHIKAPVPFIFDIRPDFRFASDVFGIVFNLEWGAELETALGQELSRYDVVQRLQTIPGIGPITASVLS